MTMKLFAGNRSLLTGLLLFFAACGITQAGTLGVLTYAINGDEVTITDCETTATGPVAVPATIEGKTVTVIGNHAFSYCSSLTGITIPVEVTSIGLLAFHNCYALTSITIPVGVTSIGSSAFGGCSGLLSIEVEAGSLNYASTNGVLFNAGQTELIVCPGGKSGAYSIPAGVTRIFDDAFRSCRSLTNITLPDSVTHIGGSAFYNCRSLTDITIPAGVVSIGASAFSSCVGLLSIDVEAGNPQYASDGGVFFNAAKTELIVCPEGKPGTYSIPSSVTAIDGSAFKNCRSLTVITIPVGVTSIGSYTFYSCSSLMSITIPVGVTSMGDYAFYKCSSLMDITIPESVISIGNNAFRFCGSLTDIKIPSGVSSIGSYAFDGCSSLTGITIPAGVTSIGASAFSDCAGLLSIDVEAGNQHYSSVGGVLFNEDQTELIAYPTGKSEDAYSIPASVTSLVSSSFRGCSLTGITIPDGVTSVGSYVFYDCSSLASIILPSGLTSIGYSMFRNCSSLAEITVPVGVISIGSYAFNGCSLLEVITIPSGVTSMGTYTFSGCSGLSSIMVEAGNLQYTSVDGVLFNADQTEIVAYPGGKSGGYSIPDSVTSLGSGAFSDCSALTGITMPDWFSDNIRYAFYGCSGLESIDVEAGHPQYSSIDGVVFNTDQTELIKYPEGKPGVYSVPDGVTRIGNLAFGYCNSLSGITFPASLTHMGGWAFRWGTSLPSITIPAGVTSDHGAYLECTGFESIFVEEGNLQYTSVDGVLFNTNQTELVAYPAGRSGAYSVPEGVISLGSDAFSEGGVTNVTFPDSLSIIGPWAFSQCHSLTNITIPSGVTNIGPDAFNPCDGLSIATFSGNAPATFEFRVFDNTAIDFTIHYLSSNTGFTSPTWMGYPATSWFMDGGLDPAADLDQDVNGDGVTLLTAYALNLDPSLDLSGRLPQAEVAADAMGMTYYAASPGITYILETSTDLEAWTATGVSVSGLDLQFRRTATVDLTEPHRFLRLRVEQ